MNEKKMFYERSFSKRLYLSSLVWILIILACFAGILCTTLCIVATILLFVYSPIPNPVSSSTFMSYAFNALYFLLLLPLYYAVYRTVTAITYKLTDWIGNFIDGKCPCCKKTWLETEQHFGSVFIMTCPKCHVRLEDKQDGVLRVIDSEPISSCIITVGSDAQVAIN